MIKLVVVAIGAVVVAGVAAAIWGAARWERGTQALRARLEAARVPVAPATFDIAALDGLPAPVQRYFRAALAPGTPIVAAASLEHAGTFDLGSTAPKWAAFTSTQRVITRRPGFDWDGRIAMAPRVNVHVHDAYVAGEGLLHAALLGLVTLADVRGTGDVAAGELMRFLAEAAWYPTALLPSQGVRWEPIDDRSARATLADGAVSVTLVFAFDGEGLIETVRADARPRTVGDALVPTPWQGRFWNYEARAGMRIPLEGEVAWLLPEGPRPYWRGRLMRVEYEPGTR